MTLKDKITSREQAAIWLKNLQQQGKKIGFTSGAFDLLHAGHVSYLSAARAACDALIVGLNSDSSVRGYKGAGRPLNPQGDRALVLAALAAVDLVFIFDDRNNNENIKQLKPDFYIKAADYNAQSLSSKELVENYGGKVLLIPLLEGRSTSGLLARCGVDDSRDLDPINYQPAPAIFVDRDGTIIEHVEFLHEAEKVKFIPGAIDGLRQLKQAGFRLVMTTNQPGIGLGYFSKEDFFVVNRVVLRACHEQGVTFDRVYFCPHHSGENCRCRKPQPLMLERAVKEVNALLAKSYVIGDMSGDIQLAKNGGCRGVLVATGLGGKDRPNIAQQADHQATSLREAAAWIVAQSSL